MSSNALHRHLGMPYDANMHLEAIRKLLGVRPFEPIDVELSIGQVFTIKKRPSS
jgi:hypothetical protein